jgi:hypothetical protein
LEKDTGLMLQERIMMKEEHQEMQQQFAKVWDDHLKLQQQFIKQKQEKVELQKKVTNIETTLILEEQLECKLSAARKEANFITQMDKEVLIWKNLEELYGGKTKGFKVQFDSMEMFVNQVCKAVGGLQKE